MMPKGEEFSRERLEEACARCHTRVPVDRLIEYGNECNWLTRHGRSFKTIEAFVCSYNSVWLQKIRHNYQKKKKRIFIQPFLFDKTNYEQQQMNNAFLNAMESE